MAAERTAKMKNAKADRATLIAAWGGNEVFSAFLRSTFTEREEDRLARDRLVQAVRKEKDVAAFERALLVAYKQDGNEPARAALMAMHNGFCVRQVANYLRKHPDFVDRHFDDMAQVAREGLLKGIEEFKLEEDVRLLSYAGNWIKKYVHEYFINNQVIQSKNKLMTPTDKKAVDLYDAWMSEHNLRHPERPPTMDERNAAAVRIGRPVIEVETARTAYFGHPVWLDAPAYEEMTLLDLQEDSAPDVAERVVDRVTAAEVRAAMPEVLTPGERKLIEARYCRGGDEPVSLTDLAEHWGGDRNILSREERRGLQALKNHFNPQEVESVAYHDDAQPGQPARVLALD